MLSAEALCAWAFVMRHRARWLVLLFFVNGVAVSNHLMAALSLAVFGVWALIMCFRRQAPWWALGGGVAAWLAGGALYWIVIAFDYGQTGSWAATLRSATTGTYGAAVFNMTALPALMGRTVLCVGLNYPTPLIAAGVIGLVVLWRGGGAFDRLLLALAAVYFAWAARYRVPDQYAFFIPFYVVASVMIGTGCAKVLAGRRAAWRATALALALLPVGVYAVLPTVARRVGVEISSRRLPYRDPYGYFLRPWKTEYDGARRFAEEALDGLPERAVLLADSTPRAPLTYVWDVEGRRPDVLLAGSAAARHGDPLADEPWYGDKNLFPALTATGRRAFVASKQPDYVPGWVRDHARLESRGVLYEVLPAASRSRNDRGFDDVSSDGGPP